VSSWLYFHVSESGDPGTGTTEPQTMFTAIQLFADFPTCASWSDLLPNLVYSSGAKMLKISIVGPKPQAPCLMILYVVYDSSHTSEPDETLVTLTVGWSTAAAPTKTTRKGRSSWLVRLRHHVEIPLRENNALDIAAERGLPRLRGPRDVRWYCIWLLSLSTLHSGQ
jgi:hypothetical protein